MNIQDTVKYLQLQDKQPSNKDNHSVKYDLSQTEYGKIFTLLDRNESDWDENSGQIDNSDENSLVSQYEYEEDGNLRGTLTLEADLENDIYTITIKEEEE